MGKGYTNAVINVSGGGSGGGGNLVYAQNNLDIETVPAGEKVLLNIRTDVSDYKANTNFSFVYNNTAFLGNDFFVITSSIYKINEDLTLTKVATCPNELNNPGIVYQYKNISYWSNQALNLFNQNTYETNVNSYSYTLGVQNCDKFFNVPVNSGYVYVKKLDETSLELSDIFNFTCKNMAGNITATDREFIFYDKEQQILLLRENINYYGYLGTYKINFENKTAEKLQEFSPSILLNTNVERTFQVNEHSFLQAGDNKLYKYTINANGTLSRIWIDDKGYASYIEARQNNTSSFFSFYNTKTKTFLCVVNKIVHILVYDDENLCLNEIITKDISNIVDSLPIYVPSGREKIYYYAGPSDDNRYIGVICDRKITTDGYYPTIICLDTNVSDFFAEKVSRDNFSTTSLVGYATGNTSENGMVEVSTMLPSKQTITITVNADNANIEVKGVD